MLSSTDLPTTAGSSVEDFTASQSSSFRAFPLKEKVASCDTDETIYSAIYSGVPVFEMICKNVAVMRRRLDSFLNATQILKVAGIDKGKRTKILEREILCGEHEKVQGGYGKYQGTWIPYARAVQLAQQYDVERYIHAILEFDPPVPGQIPIYNRRECTPKLTNQQALAEAKKLQRAESAASRIDEPLSKRQKRLPPPKKKELIINEPMSLVFDEPILPPPIYRPERHRSALLGMFMNPDPNLMPEFLVSSPQDLDVNLMIDEKGHTSLHWAAALSRIPIFNQLLMKQANTLALNCNGESALIRAVLVPNNYDHQSFHVIVAALSICIPIADARRRTVLHHIALAASITGRHASCRYYVECVLERIARTTGDFSLVDLQDQNGDTALNIAARVGCRNIVDQLMEVGANPNIENRAGLRAFDFGIEIVDVHQTQIHQQQMHHIDPVHHDDIGSIGAFGEGFEGSLTRVESSDSIVSYDRSRLAVPIHHHSYQPASCSARVIFPIIADEEPQGIVRSPVLNLSMERSRLMITEKLRGTGKEVSDVVQKLIDDLGAEYFKELRSKIELLAETQQNLRNVTKELAQIRRTNTIIKAENEKIPALMNKIHNLEVCLSQEINKQYAALSTCTLNNQNIAGASGFANEISYGSVEQIKQSLAACQSNELSLLEEIVALKSVANESELKFRKVIGACAGIPTDSVEEMMDSLLAAVESDDASRVNVSHLANFMTRVKHQEESDLGFREKVVQ